MIQCENLLYGTKTRRWRGANHGALAASGGRRRPTPCRLRKLQRHGDPGQAAAPSLGARTKSHTGQD
jgi:hypothetical protein